MRQLCKILIALSLLVLLVACSSGPKRDLSYAPPRPAVPISTVESNGSIYMSGYRVAWFEDQRARRVGDILTVILSESTNASKSAKTSTAKTNSNSISNPTIMGAAVEFNAPKMIPLATHDNNNLAFDIGSEHGFDGQGSASQSNDLSGDITVSVIEVLPNRNLFIRGEKRIGINQGNEYIKLSGIVRPQDINPDNTIASNRIADVTILYNGDGQVADSGVMGWLSRFFNSELFPF